VAVAADNTARVQTGRERERLLRELELERARLAYVFRQAPTFLAVLRGPTHVFELVNAAYTQLVGRHDLVGQPLLTALPELREQGFLELLDGVLASGEPFVGRAVPVSLARMPGAVPELRFVDFVYQPVVEADGTRSGVIAHGSDVTEQVQARREVERLLAESEQARRDAEMARAEAQAANRAKSEFLAVMSHELRTPLNAIGGYAELMELGIRGPVTEQQLEDLGRIQRSQRHLLGLVNEVLNYAKLESGNVRYALADVPVPDALADAAALVVPQARAKGLTLTIGECPPDLAVRADSEKLRQVLVNVLGNAVKFTDTRGHVTVTCADRAPWVALQVRDTGIGIPADKLGAIFEPFVQVRADLTRTADGTGLGLAISRDLARGMGGDLTAESTPGVGSTFTLTLPALGPKGT
jgi:signal transduction histidine kinase